MRFYDLNTIIGKIINNLPPKSNVTTNDEDGDDINLVTEGQYHSGLVVCSLGAASGSPTGISVVFTLEQSEDGETFEAVDGKTVTLTAANAVGQIDFAPNELQEYIRVNRLVTLTGGSSPAVITQAMVALCHGRDIPE